MLMVFEWIGGQSICQGWSYEKLCPSPEYGQYKVHLFTFCHCLLWNINLNVGSHSPAFDAGINVFLTTFETIIYLAIVTLHSTILMLITCLDKCICQYNFYLSRLFGCVCLCLKPSFDIWVCWLYTIDYKIILLQVGGDTPLDPKMAIILMSRVPCVQLSVCLFSSLAVQCFHCGKSGHHKECLSQ